MSTTYGHGTFERFDYTRRFSLKGGSSIVWTVAPYYIWTRLLVIPELRVVFLVVLESCEMSGFRGADIICHSKFTKRYYPSSSRCRQNLYR